MTLPLWAAIRTLKSKLGTGVGYAMAKEMMPTLSEQEWARAIGQARAALSARTSELTRPLNRIPVGGEVFPYESDKRTGYMQQIEVHVKDRDTGLTEVRPYTIRTDTLRSRQWAINTARAKFDESIENDPDNYPEDIVAVIYMGTYEFVPKAA